MKQPLKLRAQDKEDVEIISAVLQDAILPFADAIYNPAEKNFVAVLQRFIWDDPQVSTSEGGEKGCVHERVCCAIDVQGVTAVQMQGIEPSETGRMLELLALVLEGDMLQLIFAGEARIRLKLASWQLKIEDFGEPWPTPRQPCHGVI